MAVKRKDETIECQTQMLQKLDAVQRGPQRENDVPERLVDGPGN